MVARQAVLRRAQSRRQAVEHTSPRSDLSFARACLKICERLKISGHKSPQLVWPMHGHSCKDSSCRSHPLFRPKPSSVPACVVMSHVRSGLCSLSVVLSPTSGRPELVEGTNGKTISQSSLAHPATPRCASHLPTSPLSQPLLSENDSATARAPPVHCLREHPSSSESSPAAGSRTSNLCHRYPRKGSSPQPNKRPALLPAFVCVQVF